MKKKRNRRNKDKYPALKPELNLKTRTDLIDHDYVKKLQDKKIPHCNNEKGDCSICNNPKTRMINPKKWLNDFNEEYVNDMLDRENLDNNLHNTESLKKDCDDRNNSRNRCIVTRAKASNNMIDYEKIKEGDLSVMSAEDKMILEEELKLMKQRKNRKSRKNQSQES